MTEGNGDRAARAASDDELAALIDSLFARKRDRRSRLLAVLGTSEASRVQTKVGEFTVVPVHSEVELRRALPRFDVIEDARLVFLVPWDELPLDISGRFAGHGPPAARLRQATHSPHRAA